MKMKTMNKLPNKTQNTFRHEIESHKALLNSSHRSSSCKPFMVHMTASALYTKHKHIHEHIIIKKNLRLHFASVSRSSIRILNTKQKNLTLYKIFRK